jgi:hypothetical protein
MGYSEYFNTKGKELSGGKFLLFSDQATRIVNYAREHGISLSRGYDGEDAFVTTKRVMFNGVGQEGHEDFCLSTYDREWYCKTLMKPYGDVVQAILIAFKLRFEDDVEVESDGNQHDWKRGIKLFTDAIGFDPKVELILGEGRGCTTLTLKN